MSEIFVAGDIHGNYQGLMESLNAAGWQEGNTIICVGDVTDRGKDNARTVSFLQEHECDVRLVQGNHELQHRKMLQYYHVLIKVPQIRLFAAGIFRTYKAGYTYPKTKEELKEYECSADKRIEIIQGKPKTFHAFVRAFIAYTLAWEDDSLWKIILYLLEVMCGNPYGAERTIYEYLSCTRKQRAAFEWLWNQTATEVNIDYTEPYKYQHIVITHNNPFGRYYSYDPDEVRSGHDKTLYIFGHIPHSEIVRFDRDCSGCTYLDIDTSPNSVGVIILNCIRPDSPYQASEVSYSSNKTLFLNCPECGNKWVISANYLTAQGISYMCGNCNQTTNFISKPEQYAVRIAMGFARENGVPNAFDEVRHIFGYNNKYGVDFVDNTRKVCMEYNGVYWHKDKKRVDCYKFIKIHNAGYTFIRILEPGLKAFDKKYDIVLPKNYKHGNEYESKIMEDLGYKLISLFEEIYNYKATPEIQKLVDFKEFEKWYDIHRKRISAKATDNAAKKVA